MALKSMYEGARSGVWKGPSYQQLQADLYFLFCVCFDVTGSGAGSSQFDYLPSVLDDTFPVYSGLFNEVISSSLARFLPFQATSIGAADDAQ